MRERLKVIPVVARIMLANEINYVRGHHSEAAARALHGDYWERWYKPYLNPPPLTPARFLHDAQRSQLLIEWVDQVLTTLRDREQRLVRSRFGLDQGVIRTLEEVGAEVGCTRARTKQLIDIAFRKLRHPSRSKYLREFLPE